MSYIDINPEIKSNVIGIKKNMEVYDKAELKIKELENKRFYNKLTASEQHKLDNLYKQRNELSKEITSLRITLYPFRFQSRLAYKYCI